LRYQVRRRIALGIHRVYYLNRQAHIEQALRRSWRARSLELRNDAAHDAVIRMARSTVRSPGDHDIGIQAPQLFRDALGRSINEPPVSGVVTELAIRKAEEDRWMQAQRLRSTARLLLREPWRALRWLGGRDAERAPVVLRQRSRR
jgi:hypothetical protein